MSKIGLVIILVGAAAYAQRTTIGIMATTPAVPYLCRVTRNGSVCDVATRPAIVREKERRQRGKG
jgi:hypothetical protein